MSLSVTGNLLTSPFGIRPDITEPKEGFTVKKSVSQAPGVAVITQQDQGDGTVVFNGTPATKKNLSIKYQSLKIDNLNISGWVPGLSSITGGFRSIVGLAHFIIHLVKSFFDEKNKAEHLKEAQVGFYNFIRGLVEFIPIAGNLVVIIYDLYRLNHQNKERDNIVYPQVLNHLQEAIRA